MDTHGFEQSRNDALDVSGAVLEPFILVSKALASDEAKILDGLPHLKQRPKHVSWDDVCLLYHRMEEMAEGRVTLEECGHLGLEAPRFNQIMRAAAAVTSPKMLYTLGTRFSLARVFRHLQLRQRELPDGDLELTIRIPNAYRHCEQFFRVTRGVLEAVPKILGQPKATVEVKIENRCGTFIVRPPKSQTLMARAIRGWKSLLVGPAALQQLVAQQDELNAQYKELQRAYVDVQAALEVKQRFMSVMSHELRTPLNGIIGATSAIRTEDDPTMLETMLDALDHSSGSMARLIDSILELARSNEKPPIPVRVEVDVGAVVEEVITPVRLACERKGLAFHIELDSSVTCSRFRTDGPRLAQVIDRLLDNAVKFTDSGQVKLSIRYAKSFLEVSVADTGIGIDEKHHRAVFELFRQVDDGSTRAYGGVGLGLTLVERQVQAMRGTLELHSAVGKGTTVTVRAPAAQTAAPATTNLPANTERTALIVDDDRVNRLVISRMLKKLQWTVAEAKNGQEAVDIALSDDFEVIFMDCEMPVMNGWDATERIKAAQPESPPIIAVTAYVSDEDRERCRQAGMCDFIAKPISPGRVKQALARWTGEEHVSAK